MKTKSSSTTKRYSPLETNTKFSTKLNIKFTLQLNTKLSRKLKTNARVANICLREQITIKINIGFPISLELIQNCLCISVCHQMSLRLVCLLFWNCFLTFKSNKVIVYLFFVLSLFHCANVILFIISFISGNFVNFF